MPGSDSASPAGTASVSVTSAPYDASRTTRPAGPQLVLEATGVGVGGVDLDQLASLPAQHARLVQRERDRVGVGPDQAADPEQGAAEPPGHHGDDVAEPRDRAGSPASARRPTRRAHRRRWSGRCRRRAEDERRAVVAGVPVPARAASTTSRAASSSPTRSSRQRNRERRASTSTSAVRAGTR